MLNMNPFAMKTRGMMSENLESEIAHFKDEFFNRQVLKELGWREAESLNIEGCSSWEDVAAKAEGNSVEVGTNGWPRKPLILRNQSLFQIDTSFLRDVKLASDGQSFLRLCETQYPLDKQFSRVYKQVNCKEESLSSFGFTMSMKGLVKFEVPLNMNVTKEDALFACGPWYTDGHVETGGDDSISFTPVGEKLFLIAERGMSSVKFERKMRDARYFMRYIKQGPSKEDVDKVRFYIADPDAILCQPALCSHAVLTFSTGPSFVLGWEGAMLSDTTRAAEVLRYYAFGVRRSFLKNRILEQGCTETLAEFGVEKNCDAVEHLGNFEKTSLVVLPSGSKAGRPKGLTKKYKRSLNLPNQKARFLASTSVNSEENKEN